MITREELRRLLLERGLPAVISGAVEDDTEIALDSLSLVWLLHVLEEEHGIRIVLEDGDTQEFTSVERIHRYLERKSSLLGRVRPGG